MRTRTPLDPQLAAKLPQPFPGCWRKRGFRRLYKRTWMSLRRPGRHAVKAAQALERRDPNLFAWRPGSAVPLLPLGAGRL